MGDELMGDQDTEAVFVLVLDKDCVGDGGEGDGITEGVIVIANANAV
jgi:hypothetical protein